MDLTIESIIVNSFFLKLKWLGCQDKDFEKISEPDICIFLDCELEAIR